MEPDKTKMTQSGWETEFFGTLGARFGKWTVGSGSAFIYGNFSVKLTWKDPTTASILVIENAPVPAAVAGLKETKTLDDSAFEVANEIADWIMRGGR